jgi:hypothetical protein
VEIFNLNLPLSIKLGIRMIQRIKKRGEIFSDMERMKVWEIIKDEDIPEG